MKKQTNYIEELKNMGATDEQLNQIKNLEDLYNSENTYKKIEEVNQELMGERLKPVSLNYENAYRLLKYNIYGNIQSIITEYEHSYLLVNQGTTAEYENYTSKLSEELQEIGVYNATQTKLKASTLSDIEHWYSAYKRYEAIGDERGMSWAREQLINIIEGA